MLARNALLNFAALAIPLFAAVVAVPILARSLGAERFGLLGLAWAALEYLAMLDAGITRATTQSVAVTLTRDPRQARQVVVVSLTLLVSVGSLLGAAFATASPWFTSVLDVPAAHSAEAVALFRVVGLSVPVVLVMTSLRGVLEGAHRFDISAHARIPGTLAAILIPAIGVSYGMSLPAVMLLVLVARTLICAYLVHAIPRSIPGFEWEAPREWERLRAIGGFAAWVAVSSVISPVLVYLDRFLLTAAAGIAATGYYVGPYEGISRLLIVPISLAGALFPALAGMTARGPQDAARAGRVIGAALRQIFLAVLPASALIATFAPWILDTWLGTAFAERSGTALRILAAGVLVNALAHVPYAYLQASGRPDLTAKFHVFELFIHVPLTWWLVSRYGVTGAAIAWTSRVSLDAVLLATATVRIRSRAGHPPRFMSRAGIAAVSGGTGLLLALALAARELDGQNAATLLVSATCLAIFAAFTWRRALVDAERAAILGMLRRRV
jgi:O-antigen/teichoic acid export membrane protein